MDKESKIIIKSTNFCISRIKMNQPETYNALSSNMLELLIKSFTPEVFYQINTGNRVHFHTHNELFEHILKVKKLFFHLISLMQNFR